MREHLKICLSSGFSGQNAVAVIHPVAPQVRLLSESLRMARERRSNAVLDGDFGRDLEHVVNSHCEPRTPPAWD
jgi:hypothetical protein